MWYRVCGRAWTLWGYLFFRVGVILLRHWPEDAPSNCLLWALQQQMRHGGRLLFERSRYGSWQHCLWIRPDGRMFEFNPPEKVHRRFPPMLFHGKPYETTR